MKPSTHGLRVLAIAGWCIGWHAAGAHAQGMQEAMDYYDRQQFALAQQTLVAAAETGVPGARDVLGFMYAAGPGLFPGAQQDTREAVRWFGLSARDGSPVARHMACKLSRRLQDPRLQQQNCTP